MKRRHALQAALVTALPAMVSAQANALTVYAAGSLRGALTQIGQDFEASAGGVKVNFVFGASGLLRDRLQSGEQADVFASANMDHPRALADAGKARPVQAFARNALCALAAPGFELRGKSLAERLLDADVKIGISTPKADPSGDYAFEMFERIENSGVVGAAERLKRKALQLTGGPSSPPPPADRNLYGALMSSGQADVFITYCTNAAIARKEVPQLQTLPVPEAINVSAGYGLAVMQSAAPLAQRFVEFILGAAGQRRLAEAGFLAPR